jgi:hypothetical protein
LCLATSNNGDDDDDYDTDAAITHGDTENGNQRNIIANTTSGTTTTDEPDLLPLGIVPMNTSSTDHRQHFSLFRALGYIPTHLKIVAKNETGVALTGGSIKIAEVFETID